MPWAYTRRQLAHAWGVPPWEVDDAPGIEVLLELRLSQIEHECAPKTAGS